VTGLSWALVATVVIHGGLAVSVASLPEKRPPPPPTVITVREVPRKQALPPPPPPPPPIPEPPAITPAPLPKAKPPPRAKPAAPPPAVAAAAPAPVNTAPADFGVRLGNGAEGNGASVPAPRETAAEPAPLPKPKTLAAAPEPGGCSEALIKPKPISVVQPAFTQEARDAQITGKVRVEITISASGAVTSAKVIAGLGHGLDEAALEAARASTFSPATKCGEAVETTFTIGMRFQ